MLKLEPVDRIGAAADRDASLRHAAAGVFGEDLRATLLDAAGVLFGPVWADDAAIQPRHLDSPSLRIGDALGLRELGHLPAKPSKRWTAIQLAAAAS
jgi:hypothetical protein